MADIIKKVKKAIVNKSDAQAKAQEAVDDARKKLAAVETVDDANALIEVAHGLNKIHKKAFMNQMIKELAVKGIDFDKKGKKFVKHEDAA